MSKTVAMIGVVALAAATALAQSTTTTSGQSSTSTSGQASATKDKGQHTGHGMTPSDQKSTAATGGIAAADRRFIDEAARGGMAEVALGKLATEKASSAEVKSFGQMMVDDHSKANDELKTLASEKSVTLPTDEGPKMKAMQTKLEKLSGEAFDRAYMQHMVSDHKKDVAAFKKASQTSKDQGVKDFASKTLPTLEKHLQKAQEVAAQTGKTGATAGKATEKKSTEKKKTTTP